ncbi:MAG: phenazine biosynthesis protein PhzF, partial [Pseudomonadota bacterium]
AYLWKHGLIGTRSYLAEQGHGMGRPGQARVEILGPPGDPTTIRVGGQAHVLMSGQLHLG